VQTALLSLLTAGGIGVFACGDYTPQFQHEGRAQVASLGARAATLQGTCHIWGRPTFELELRLPGVEPDDLRADGADGAPASTAEAPRAAVVLSWMTTSSRAKLATVAMLQREYDAPQPLLESPRRVHIVQTIENVSGGDEAADFFRGLEAEPGSLTWTQTDSPGAPRKVEASFAFGAADAVALRTAALQCRAATLPARDPG